MRLAPHALGPGSGNAARSPKIIECVQYEQRDLSSMGAPPAWSFDQVSDAHGKYFKIRFHKGAWVVEAQGICGYVPLLPDVALLIKPRFPTKGLTRLVAAAGYKPVAVPLLLRSYEPAMGVVPWVVEGLVDGLLSSIETVAHNGFLRVYVRREGEGSKPRGRIDISGTVLRFAPRGIYHQAVYSWHEKTVDNPANQHLKLALRVALGECTTMPVKKFQEKDMAERVSRIRRCLYMFRDVRDVGPRETITDPWVTGRIPPPLPRLYYRDALMAANALLDRVSLDPDSGASNAPNAMLSSSLTVDVEELFEAFVRQALAARFAGSPVSILDGNVEPHKVPMYARTSESSDLTIPSDAHHVTQASPHMTPDIIVQPNGGSHPIVMDVKCDMVEVGGDAKRKDVEQTLAYAVRYGAEWAITIHPMSRKHQERTITQRFFVSGHVGPIKVGYYLVDLAADDIDAELDRMATTLRALIPTAGAASPHP